MLVRMDWFGIVIAYIHMIFHEHAPPMYLTHQLFECHIPQPVHMIATLIQEDEEYPIVCFGVNER